MGLEPGCRLSPQIDDSDEEAEGGNEEGKAAGLGLGPQMPSVSSMLGGGKAPHSRHTAAPANGDDAWMDEADESELRQMEMENRTLAAELEHDADEVRCVLRIHCVNYCTCCRAPIGRAGLRTTLCVAGGRGLSPR